MMAEKKKKQPAEFAKDKNAFTDGSPIKGKRTAQRAKQKQSGAHQPRDADVTERPLSPQQSWGEQSEQ